MLNASTPKSQKHELPSQSFWCLLLQGNKLNQQQEKYRSYTDYIELYQKMLKEPL